MDCVNTCRIDLDETLTPLPPAVFLDFSDSYKFRVGLKGSPNISAAELNVMFSLNSDGHVMFETKKTIDPILNVANYDITLKDRADVEYFQDLPGQNLHPSSLTIYVGDTGFACKDSYKKSSIKVSFITYTFCGW